MMARLYCVVVTLLLLAEVSGFEEGATNPGVVARITRKGLAYARQLGVAILKKELSTIKLPDFSGSFKVSWIKTVSYDFYRLTIHRFELRNSDLRLRPRQGVRASLSNNYMFVSGNWKVKKAFVTLDGTFDVNVDGISISVSLNLGKDQSGRPTASVAHCRNSIGHISVDISGQLSWILNLLHKRIENNFKNILEQKIREMVRKSTTSHLEPYLRTPPGLEAPSFLWVPSDAMTPVTPRPMTTIISRAPGELSPWSTSPSHGAGYGVTTSLGGLFWS
uniref:Bactericidal permeability-increasing protein n=1 Tax=Callorhinus ursinus TaxID=34884 RepID=A0A3Q7PCL9_CALUR|nr:lipopolysaccharide-binding protein-like isoform X3 [Callorhinus ursinus]